MTEISKYNHFQRWRDGYYIAYNAASGAVGLMTEENYNAFRILEQKLNSGEEPEFTPQEQELIEQLQYGGFVFSGGFDELKEIEFSHLMNRYDRASLGLIIAPTMACNMACRYCFEDNKKGRMSATIVESILDFVEQRARGLEQVDINWYGGEPLLAMDIIEDLTESILDLGDEYRFDYTSSMVTNGYLLTRENVDRLTKLKVSMVQITLDGPAKIHNTQRPLKNGGESFETIIKNIKYASTKMAVGLRVNIDKSFDGEMIAEMLDELKDAGLQDRVGIYFGLLEPASPACANIAENCFNNADFSEVEIEYYRLLLEQGFRIEKLPTPVSTFCIAQLVNAFLIDPEGRIYKCFNYPGDATKAMGSIRQEINYNHPNFSGLFNFSPFEDQSCKDCAILPVCMGGCPSRRADRTLEKDELCESWKHNLHRMLEIIALSRQPQAASAAKEQA